MVYGGEKVMICSSCFSIVYIHTEEASSLKSLRNMAPKLRGRSTSLERQQAGVPHLTRSEMAAFVAGVAVNDTITIDWRIVSLSEPAPSILQVPFQRMSGTVEQIEELSDAGNPKCVLVNYFTIDQATQERVPQGIFELPPQQLEGAFIEVCTLAKSAPLLPSFAQILRPKRAREEAPREEPAPRNDLRDLVEAITKEDVKRKTEVCQGLKIVVDDSMIWHPFRLYDWVQLLRTKATEQQRQTVISTWRMELLQSLTDAGVNFAGTGDNVAAVRQYNDCRDQYARWLMTTPDIALEVKRQWELGFQLLFHLAGAAVAINHGFSKGVQMRSELTVEFEKSAATIDIAAALNKIFRAGRQGGGPTATKTRGSFGSNN